MRIRTKALLLLALAAPLVAQPRVDARKVAALEKKVQALQTTFDQSNSELRKIYNDLQEKLGKAARSNEGARLQADLVRVLEPVLTKARELAKKRGSANQRKAKALLRGEIPKALKKLEVEPLNAMASYLGARLDDIWAQTASVADALSLSDEDLAKRVLEPALDERTPFFERWNAGLSASVDGAAAFRKAHMQLAQAKIDLAIAKDPLLAFQIGCDEGFARVPPGSYVINSTSGFTQGVRKKKQRRVSIDREVWIGLREVTNAEYLEWLRALGEDDRQKHLPRNAAGTIIWPLDPEKGENLPPAGKMDHPVVGINLQSACLYALSRGCRLPTETEWCAMAGGRDGFPYPWGENWIEGRCNDREAGNDDTRPVGSFKDGRGPFGHYDVAGNVSEWLLTYENGKPVDPKAIEADGVVAVRGGSFRDGKRDVGTGWVWLKRALFERDEMTGFRIARYAPAEKKKRK